MQILRIMTRLCMDQRCYAFSPLFTDKMRRSMYSVGSDAELTAALSRLIGQAMGVSRVRVGLGVYWTYPVIGGGIFSARVLKLLNETP